MGGSSIRIQGSLATDTRELSPDTGELLGCLTKQPVLKMDGLFFVKSAFTRLAGHFLDEFGGGVFPAFGFEYFAVFPANDFSVYDFLHVCIVDDVKERVEVDAVAYGEVADVVNRIDERVSLFGDSLCGH